MIVFVDIVIVLLVLSQPQRVLELFILNKFGIYESYFNSSFKYLLSYLIDK